MKNNDTDIKNSYTYVYCISTNFGACDQKFYFDFDVGRPRALSSGMIRKL